MRLLVYLFISVSLLACQQNKVDKAGAVVKPQSLSPIASSSKSSIAVPAINKIAFGSCNHEDDPQDYWHTIANENPDLWIWMGDNIYGDSKNMSVLEKKYQRQKTAAPYKSFVNKVPVIGTWDDHDYGTNDGNKYYRPKAESKKLMLDFLDVAKDRDVWKREGVYDSYVFGAEGQKVQVILLDTRSFQDGLKKSKKGKSRYQKSEGDILGEAQWTWLKNLLDESHAEITLIVSSIQFLSEEHRYEKWANFPNAHKRMHALLQKAKQKNVIILSGDRHIAEISKWESDNLSYPLYDITSSGLTHSYEKANEENKYRVSKLNGQKNFGQLVFDWQQDAVSIQALISGMRGDTIINYNLGSFEK